MNPLGLVKAVVDLAATLVGWLRDRRLINDARGAASAQQLQEVIDALARADHARRRIDRDGDAHPERLRNDDGFRRD